MRYINKKLPLIEIGKEITWSNPDAIGIHFYEEGELHCGEPILNSLIEDGFIEEVKPREYFVELWKSTPDGQPSDICIEYHNLREDNRFTIIKVREVNK